MTTINESLTAKGYTPAASVLGTFGVPRRIESITVHHWGAFGQSHDGVVNFFVNGPGATSAHFVVSAGRIHCLVSPVDASWAAGNAYGNATSIHIECRPEASEADYATTVELIQFLRNTYGANLPLIPHRNWQATACPGIWDLGKLDRLARGGAVSTPAPAPVAPKPAPVAPASTRKTYSNGDMHWIVESGDTLSKIARHYYGDAKYAQQIATYNGIALNSTLNVGDRIWVNGPIVWVIEQPDSIRSIAAYYGLDALGLARRNGLPSADSEIYIGNTMRIL